MAETEENTDTNMKICKMKLEIKFVQFAVNIKILRVYASNPKRQAFNFSPKPSLYCSTYLQT